MPNRYGESRVLLGSPLAPQAQLQAAPLKVTRGGMPPVTALEEELALVGQAIETCVSEDQRAVEINRPRVQ